jgi:hypothetical protein
LPFHRKQYLKTSSRIQGIQGQRFIELLDCCGTTIEARLTLNQEREEFEASMKQRRSALVSNRSTMLQEIETKRVIKRRALDLERSLILQELHVEKEAAMLQIRN